MKEYKMAKGYAISIFICAPILLTSFVALLLMPFFNEETAIETAYFFCPLGLVGIILITIALLDTIYGKLIIDDTTIRIKSTLINRSLHFNEIKGFKTDDKHVYILPKSKNKKRIKSHSYINNYEEFLYWLSNNFIDLNKVDETKEIKSILQNHDFGMNENEREEEFKKAKTISKIINLVGVVIGVALIVPSKYLHYFTSLALIFYLISTIILVSKKGLIRIGHDENSIYPTILWAYLGLSGGLALKALFSFNILDHSKIWIPLLSIPIFSLAIILTSTKEFNFKKIKDLFEILGLFIILLGFSYGAIILTNAQYDKEEAIVFKTKIIDKRINNSKTTTYYFKFKSWVNDKETIEGTIPKSLYKQKDIGNNITIHQKEGVFNIPYFLIYE